MTTRIGGTSVAKDGSFSMSGIPPGTYTLTVTNGYSRRGATLEIAETPLEVRDTSITDIKVLTARGATVSGRLEWAGPGPPPWPRKATLGRIRAVAVGRSGISRRWTARFNPMGRFNSQTYMG
jgi:hypothetical protein